MALGVLSESQAAQLAEAGSIPARMASQGHGPMKMNVYVR